MGIEASQILQGRLGDPEQSLPATTALASERLINIDALRVVAAIGIVWFHTSEAPYKRIGYAGLPIFLLIFFSLIVHRGGTYSTYTFLKRRWNRLLKPWLFWSLLYGVLQLVRAVWSGNADSLHQLASPQVALAGTHIHLWYLPFAFASGVLVYALNRHTMRFNNTVVVFIATGLGLLLLTLDAIGLASRHLMYPLPQWGFGLAAIPLGLAVGRSLMAPSHALMRFLLASIVLVTLATSMVLIGFGYASAGIPYGLAVVLVTLAYSWQTTGNGAVAALAPLTFGVYLIHPLVSFWLRHWVAVDQHYAAFIGLTVCVSGLITLGLMKTRMKEFV